MAGVASEEVGAGRSTEGSGQRYQAGELAEWRSSEQVENGTPSTSPPYWDTDDEDDGGLKPSELYGKYTWKIEKFSQTNKRELRSNAFEVGGYKWYILIYPQGCDVCNHLSLFLCVSNHDKLLPGWSHFAQFTIAVVNKDPKKSKYSDTLHRFWKKEHDWGWKKFMELSKVSDGFLDAADTLIIKAQVQVIREKAERPFRCLDCHYRRELVRVYLTNVEQICRRFVEERRGKLGRLIEDKNRWSSFCSFWLGMDQNSRRRMSREKADVVLKVVVKNFFIEKEVTSTLVMDSLYSGLKALQGQNQTKSKKGRAKVLDAEEMPAPIVRMEKDMFVLVDDVLLLLERAATEPLPPKDEKGPQNRTKDGNSGEDFNKDLIERDERRLTELGRRTVEIFVLSHIFNNKIEVAHQEAVALKRQEELIREEAEWLAESEQKGKRGASEKEKKSKKKQAKQKRNNRKGKDKGKEENAVLIAVEKDEEPDSGSEKTDSIMGDVHPEVEKPDIMEEASEMSDSVDGASEVIQPDSEDREVSPVNWDTDTSEAHPPTEACSSGVSGLSSVPNGTADKKSTSAMDDSSSTCSTDSVPSVVMNGPYKGSSYSDHHSEKSPGRGKNQQTKVACDTNWTTETDNNHSELTMDAGTQNDGSESGKTHESEFAAAVHDLQDRITRLEQHVVKKEKEEEVVYPQKKLSGKDLAYGERHTKETRTVTPPSPSSTPRGPKDLPPTVQMRSETKNVASVDVVQVRKVSSNSPQQVDKTVTSIASTRKTGMPKSEIQSTSTPKVSDRPVPQLQQQPQSLPQPQPPSQPQPQRQPPQQPPTPPQTPQQPQTQPPQQPQQVPVMSRPSSAPLMPGPRPTAPVVTVVHSTPLLARSVSATGRLGPDPSATHSYVPQSYRNAIIGNSVGSSSSGFAHANIPPSSSGFAHANIPPSSSGFAHANIPPSSSGFAHVNVPPSSSGFAHANVPPSSSGFAHANVPPSSGGNFLPAHLQPATLVSSPTFLPQSSDRMEQNSVQTGFPFGMVTGDVLQNGSQWMDNSHRGTNRTAHSDPSLLTSSIQNLELYQPVPSGSQEQHFTDFSTRTASRQTQVVRDEYPHLDIINDLLDDEQVIGNAAGVNRVFQPLNNGPHLDRQYTFPCDVGVSGDSGPSNGSSSCRFDRMRSYHDGGFQRAYSTSGAHLDGIREFVPQASQLSYANGHNDVMVPNQWQIGGSDLSMAGLSNAEGDGSQYFNPEYSNLQCGVNGYTVYRPSNGH